MPEEEYLKVSEVAALLRTRPETVRRWLKDGKLPGVKLGGDRTGYRIARSEVDRLMRGQGVTVSSTDPR